MIGCGSFLQKTITIGGKHEARSVRGDGACTVALRVPGDREKPERPQVKVVVLATKWTIDPKFGGTRGKSAKQN